MARSVRLALQGEFVPDAVNVQAGGVVAEDVRAGLPLAEKLGPVLHRAGRRAAQRRSPSRCAARSPRTSSVLQLAALKGVFTDVVEEQVTFVNAPLLADDARRRRSAWPPTRRARTTATWCTVRGAMPTARRSRVSGTLTGRTQVQKLTEVDGFDVDLRAEGHLLFFRYTDRPGVVGVVGALLGEAGVNIAGAPGQPDHRRRRGADAVTVDSPVDRRARADRCVRRRHRDAAAATDQSRGGHADLRGPARYG